MEIIPATKVDSTNAQELFLQLLGLKRADTDRLHTEKGVDLVCLINHFSGVCNNLTMQRFKILCFMLLFSAAMFVLLCRHLATIH